MSEIERNKAFWSKVGIGELDECWEWKGGLNAGGYGAAYYPGAPTAIASRIAFFLAHRRWPEPCCCHSCDNRACCNPAHLFEGSHQENSFDCMRKGRTPALKLKPDDVRAIRASNEPHKRLAKRYGVVVGTIRSIALGESWRWVD